MSDNIISYIEMCTREGTSLQAGMNFGLGGTHSVILLSLRRNAPYRDRVEDRGYTLIYEGHDHPKNELCTNPKEVDQPETFPSGALTQNGRFPKLPKPQSKDCNCLNAFALTRRLNQESGHITACFTSSILGGNRTISVGFLSFAWKQLREKKT